MYRLVKFCESSIAARRVAHAADLEPPEIPAPLSPRDSSWNTFSCVMESASPEVSATNPRPANIEFPFAGATAKRVTPSMRVTSIAVADGLKLSAALSAAEYLLSSADVSFVVASAPTSTRPVRAKGTNMPGVIQPPSASITVAFDGTESRESPTATILSSTMSTTPSSIAASCVPVQTVPPVIATVSAKTGAAIVSAATAAPVRYLQIICDLLVQVDQARSPSPAIVHHREGHRAGRHR